jgi:hypothetical protein
MGACEKCWSLAFMRAQDDTSKTQSEHYLDLLEENPQHEPIHPTEGSR